MLNAIYADAMLHEGNPVAVPSRPGRGSSDFGNFSQVRSGLHPYFGIADHKIAGHSVEFRQAAGTPYAERSMLDAAVAMAQAGVLFLNDEKARTAVLEAFRCGAAFLRGRFLSVCARKFLQTGDSVLS